MKFTNEEVRNFLPHRDPFLFIDTVKDIVLDEKILKQKEILSKDLVGSKVISTFKIREDLAILAGHFPGKPILPGVIQIEMMAQTSAFISSVYKEGAGGKIRVETLLLGVESSRFRKPILPGMDLEIHATMLKSRGSIASYGGEIFCDGEKVSEAKFLAKLDVIKG